jgi:hypothetical protein
MALYIILVKTKIMRNRFQKYVESKRKNDPIRNKEQVKNSPDKHIDQDFPGYPDSPSKERIINPKTKQEKKVAAINVQDGEKVSKQQRKDEEVDEQQSDGSGGAFSATEFLIDDEE